MKKALLLLGAVVVVSLMLSSCTGAKQACAAYDQVEVPSATPSR